jgi:hypothetical protein
MWSKRLETIIHKLKYGGQHLVKLCCLLCEATEGLNFYVNVGKNFALQ